MRPVTLNPKHVAMLRAIAIVEAVQEIRARSMEAEFPFPGSDNRHERRKAKALARRAAR